MIDKLILNGVAYTVDTLNKLPLFLQPQNVATPQNYEAVVFFTKDSPLSNHHEAPFIIDGVQYNCVEQYLMKGKALEFGDMDIAQKIMGTDNPGFQKGLGKKVAGFEKGRWRAAAPAVLRKALEAKFSQSDSCKKILKDTGNKSIGEASPYDNFYGIGMSVRDKDVFDKKKWGNNLLGKCLEEVRADL